MSVSDPVSESVPNPISEELLNIMACPVCRAGLRLNPSKDGIICDACELKYPIIDDIPNMLAEDALGLAPEDMSQSTPAR